MIIVKLQGGLGNQLFQYAFAASLSLEYNLPVKADLLAYKHDRKRKFALKSLGSEVPEASAQEIECLLRQCRKPHRWWNPNRNYELVENQSEFFQYHHKYVHMAKPKAMFVDGYWQNFLYFERLNITELLNYTHKESELKIIEEINVNNSVAIHVRRGDYVTDPSVNQIHGFCGLDYYNEAVSKIKEEVKEPHFYIFSDDIEWCNSNFKGQEYSFISTGDECSDFMLMSSCKHFIIANSTYSWWAAYLGVENWTRQMVIAPNNWFLTSNWETAGLIPTNWKVI
jgi:hypothetical protein